MSLSNLKAKSMNAAKQSAYTPQQQTAGMCNARRAKLLNTVDPDGLLDAVERNRRADALLKSQMLNLVDARERKRNAKAQRIDQERYDVASNAMPHGCAWCGPIPRNATHRTCATHAAVMLAEWGQK